MQRVWLGSELSLSRRTNAHKQTQTETLFFNWRQIVSLSSRDSVKREGQTETGPSQSSESRHGLHFHCYTDDIQIYVSNKSITTGTHFTIIHLLIRLKTWMHQNLLSLNDKPDLILISLRSQTNPTPNFSLTFHNPTSAPSPHICDLGIIFWQQPFFSSPNTQLTCPSSTSETVHLCPPIFLFCWNTYPWV